MKWYYYLLIGVGILLILFLFIFLVSYIKKRRSNKTIRHYYKDIIDAVGGKENILEVSANGSRLSFVLKNPNLLKKDSLEAIHIQGIVRSSKKTILVIGEFAVQYAKDIQLELKK